MTDIVERLRGMAGDYRALVARFPAAREVIDDDEIDTIAAAAAEIERLRAECAIMKLEIDAATREGFKKAAKVAERAGIKAPAATAFDAAAAIRALLTGGKR